jgi:hypothetical protein
LTDDAEHAAFLARLRNSGIRIDREGQLWHEGEIITHEGLRRALFRWLDRNPDGRYVFRLDPQRFVYVDVDDTPLVARAARWDGDQARLALSDGSEEALDPDTLTIDAAGVLRCRVRAGKLEARLATSATAVLAERIEGESLRLGSRSIPIGPRARR